MKRYFYRESDKRFWSIEEKGTDYETTYGVRYLKKARVGSKSFSTVETCQKNIEKEIQKKLDAGYKELTVINDFSDVKDIKDVWDTQQAQKTCPSELYYWEEVSVALIKAVCKITSLEKLDFRSIEELPDEIGQLQNLKILKIGSENRPQLSISRGLSRLPLLEELELYGVSSIDIDGILQLNTLKKLEISFSDKPQKSISLDGFGQMPNLEELRLYDVYNLNYDFRVLQNLQQLDIAYRNRNGIVSDCIGHLQKLTYLRLYGAKQLPDTLWSLENLEELIIADSAIQELPKEIDKLSKLKTLSIDSYSKEKEPITLPDSFGNLKSLVKLEIEKIKVEALPESFKNLTQLQTLILDTTSFTKIPEVIFELENLTCLNIAVKNLDFLDPRLAQLEHLQTVDFYNIKKGQFKNLPEHIPNLYDWKNIKKLISKQAIPAPKGKLLPTPSQKEKQQALSDRKEKFNNFKRDSFDRMRYKSERQFERVVSFLTGEVDECPPAVPRRDDYGFQSIFTLLKPLSQWDFMDDRILTFIAQEAFDYDNGSFFFYKGLLEWLQKNSLENPTEKFENLLSALEKYGIEKDFILSRCFINGSTLLTDGSPSSMGTYLLEHFDDSPEYFIESAKNENKNAFVELFIKHRPASIEPYLPKLYLNTYDDGTNHLPYKVFDTLLEYDTKKYSKILHALTDTLEPHCNRNCKLEAAKLLVEKGSGEYKILAFGIVEETLQHISDSLARDKDFYFQWSLKPFAFSLKSIPSFIDWIFTHYGKSALPAVEKYVENINPIDVNIIKVIVEHIGEGAMNIIGKTFKANFNGNLELQLRSYPSLFDAISTIDYSPYHERVWKLLDSRSSELRLLACNEIIKFGAKTVVPRARPLLHDENEDKKELGIRLLLPFEETWGELMVVMDNEKNEDLRNLLVKKFYAVPTQITIAEAKRRVSNATERGKLNRAPAWWFDVSKLPTPKWNNGEELNEQELLYLCYRQKSWNDLSPDPEARDIYPLIDKESAKGFSSILLELVKENGGILAKNRFALTLIGMFGGDSIVDHLEKEAISGTNPNACVVLGLVGTIKAARALDNIINYFDVRYPNVRDAAQDAFKQIAEARGMLVQELQDAIMPDFGFDGLTKKIRDGNAIYELSIDPSFSLVFEDGKGKKTTRAPKMTAEAKETIKSIRKDLKRASRQFAGNLELKLCTQDVWPTDEWEERFLEKPLAFALARNFIWGTYQNGNLSKSFMVDENGHLLDMDGKVLQLENTALVKLVHPINLDTSEKDRWSAVLKERKIIPPFSQLDRKVYRVSDDRKDEKFNYDHETRDIAGSIKYGLPALGWHRGSILAGGRVSSFIKSIPAYNLEAFIMVEGVNVQPVEEDEAEKIEKLFFVQMGSVYTGTDSVNDPRSEDDHRLVPFGEVPPVVYSEVVRDIESILEQ
ncbi:DUF4132 domain-containing protein [Muricauda oceani]|uniref:DUF4132 domain-containing protein n=1 Tax=Flagellimonas oceani TaxID=2698672 RepID=A0A6G7J1J6_9FLAO|nr:DUF4132 domain-containing protein [Allomuricauda oceani]MBW8241256.1 DUF4132 domain-containing protein [Allomuricauda oceani]QII44741.1 DUF4132 domain-containing protein [Allomuricauda oceani]